MIEIGDLMEPSRILRIAFLFLAFSSCQKAPIKIGVAMVLTGLNSEIGVSGRNAVQLAVDEMNAEGGARGRKIELIIRDDGSDSERALAVDEELRAKGAVAIIGHMISASGALAVKAATGMEFPIISPTISSSDYVGKDDYLFRVLGDSGMQGNVLAGYAYKEMKLRRIATLFESTNRSYTASVETAFRREFESLGGTVLPAIAFPSGIGFDLNPIADALRKTDCDGVLSVAGAADNAALCALLEKKGSGLPVFAGMWSMTPDLIQLGGRSADRIIISGLMDSDSASPSYRRFVDGYEKRFGFPPTFASLYSYEAARYLVAAIEKSRSLRGKDIKEAMLSLGQFEGLQDSFTLDRFGDPDRSFSVFGVRDGRFVKIK